MLNLIRAEWLKLTRRPLTWILLAAFLVLFALWLGGQVFIVVVGRDFLPPAQIADFQRRIVFPGVFGAAFNHINSLGGVFAVILAAGALGNEYTWGTLRTNLARRPARAAFLLAKIMTLLLLLLIAMIITLVVAALIGLLTNGVVAPAGAVDVSVLALLPLACIRALFVLLPYVLLTICFTVMGRSLIAGLAGGVVYLVFEAGLGALTVFAEFGGIWRTLYDLTIGRNINTLVLLNSHAFGIFPEQVTGFDASSLPSPLQATLVIALYSTVFLATAIFLFERRDVMGAS